ncbi:MAG TPA: restriction endonuclease subunit S, partial [Anaerolineales bacterium]|nr:restriction endonuclease subunit S [Anaerolineales bacterium]
PPSSTYNAVGEGLPFYQGKTDFGDMYPTPRVYCTEPSRIAEAGDILISVRAPVGPTNISRERSAIGRGLSVIRPKEKLDRDFLLYYLRFYEPELAKAGTGSTFAAVAREDLETIKIPLPPLTEQKRIASLLARADRLRSLRRTGRALGESLLQSVFLEMFGGAQSNDKKWNLVTLGEKITFMTSGSRGWAEHYSDKGDLFLRIQNVGANQLLLDDVAYVQAPDTAESKRTRVQPGDLLISATADLGRTAVIPENFPTAYINQHLFLLRLKDLNPVFVAGYFSTPSGKAQILRLDREGVKSGLNFDDARSLTVFNPPLALQEEFASVVARVEGLRGRMSEAERQGEGLFESLLALSFVEGLSQSFA